MVASHTLLILIIINSSERPCNYAWKLSSTQGTGKASALLRSEGCGPTVTPCRVLGPRVVLILMACVWVPVLAHFWPCLCSQSKIPAF